MAYESLRDSAFLDTVRSFFRDLSDLAQKELRLARAELTEKVSEKLGGVVWIAVAGVLGLVAALLVIQAIVFWIASFGLALHWSCLIVAAVLAVVAAAAFFYGRSATRGSLMPNRTMRQVQEDVSAVREQLT